MIDVDVDLESGAFRLTAQFASDASIVGLFGRSGAGKTTLIHAIAGIVRPSRGRIRIDDAVLFDSTRRIDLSIQARRIGYVFQHALLFPHLSVESNLLYGHALRPHVERTIEPRDVIDLLGLTSLLERRPATLSGGERQRVAIGRALLAQPRLLLMDEPLASLDAQRKVEILDYIERLRDRLHIPIVYVSHSIPEITRLADTMVVLADGRCVAADDPERVVDQIGHGPDGDASSDLDAGSLIDARVAAHDDVDRLTTLAFNGGQLLVPMIEAGVGARVRAYLRSRDLSLALQRPEGISIVNVLAGKIVAINERPGAAADVRVAVGATMLTARVTQRSVRQLGLLHGHDVHVLIKAVSLDQRSTGYPS